MDQHRTPRPYVSTDHYARTSGAVRLQQRNVELAPFSRSDCWRVECRERFSPYLTVKLHYGTAEPEVIYVSALCHQEFVRPADLSPEAHAWLWDRS